jgi:hypothetical protein
MPLSGEKLQQLRSQMLHLKWLIIDEVSLVSNKLYNFINWRLQQIKDRSDVPFGGVNILCCGDLSQLAPVQSKWIFEDMIETQDNEDDPPPKKKVKMETK